MAGWTSSCQYTGRENDGTGAYFYRARYYSPTLQRFISEDPIGIARGINKYAYVGDNPITGITALGLAGPATWGEVAGASNPVSAAYAGIEAYRGTVVLSIIPLTGSYLYPKGLTDATVAMDIYDSAVSDCQVDYGFPNVP